MTNKITTLTAELSFPDPRIALDDPNGLLAIGGDLSPNRLILAYKNGIFPWFNEGDPIMWWSPDPRAVLFFDQLKTSRSLKKTLDKGGFQFTINKTFKEVAAACAAPRLKQEGTWITSEMQKAYIELHKQGFAMSVEAWQEGQLVGGLYGITVNKVFCGESMFNKVSNASKAAFVYLVDYLKTQDYKFIDSQILNPHMASLGVTEISRDKFLQLLKE
jgi:leucyl/phenylalanyl-tRNA---protein transferase